MKPLLPSKDPGPSHLQAPHWAPPLPSPWPRLAGAASLRGPEKCAWAVSGGQVAGAHLSERFRRDHLSASTSARRDRGWERTVLVPVDLSIAGREHSRVLSPRLATTNVVCSVSTRTRLETAGSETNSQTGRVNQGLGNPGSGQGSEEVGPVTSWAW